MKKTRNILKFFISIVVLYLNIFILTQVTTVTIFAYDDTNYEEAGNNFIQYQYLKNNIEYEEITIDSVGLYDYNDNVIAKVMIFKRDNFYYDYVVLDFIVDNIDEFGLENKTMVENFYKHEKILYAGMLNYFYETISGYTDFNGNLISKYKVCYLIDNFKMNKDIIPSANGYDGIKSWSQIESDLYANPDTIENPEHGYLQGIKFTGIERNCPEFYDQNIFNVQYNSNYNTNINGTCAITAMTNMMVYYNSFGFPNILINNNPYETFEELLVLTNWLNWKDETWKESNDWYSSVQLGFRDYITSRGYFYSPSTTKGTGWNYFTQTINNGRPIFTYLYVSTDAEDGFAHAVVTMGYEKFVKGTLVNKRYWLFGWHDNWKTVYTDYNYLRIVDGWSTSNEGRFVDFSYYSTIFGYDTI